MKLRKISALLLSVMMLVSTAGCEQAQVAGYDLNQEAENLTDEEKQKLAEYFEQVAGELREGEVPSGLLPDSKEGTEPEEKTDEKPEEEKTEKEEEDPLKNEKESAAKEAAFYELDESGHAVLSVDDLIGHYRGVNEHALDGIIAQLDIYDQENKKDPYPEKTVVKLYELLEDTYSYEEVQQCISSLIYDLDTTNVDNGDASAADSTKLTLMTNQAKMAVKRALEGPYGDSLKEVINERQVETFLSAEELSDRAKELEEKNEKLIVDYKAAMNEPLTVTYEGIEYSFEDLDNQDIAQTIRTDVQALLQKELAARVYPIYHELIVNRNEIAKEYGYDNYAEYAYKVKYGRDYTTDEIKTLANGIFEKISGLLIASILLQGDADLSSISYSASNEEMLETLKKEIITVVPELEDSLNYMIDNKLYTFGDEKVRADGAFMCPLYSTRSGFIYVKRKNTGSDYESLTHEFGHFNNGYRVSEPSLALTQRLDVLEIHSQGLELLGSSTLSEVFPDVKGDFPAAVVLSMTQAITSALMVAAFEISCYEKPDMTLEEMNLEFGKYMAICMMGGTEEQAVETGVWAEIHHIFELPLYYSAYAVSALSALDIYARYLEDPEDGVKKYVDLTSIDPNLPYKEAMSQVGLRDMTQNENIEAVFSEITKKFSDRIYASVSQTIEALGAMFEQLLTDYAEKKE